MRTVTATLAGMRKAQEFVVYPANGGHSNYNEIIVQSERAIGYFDRDSGRGILNWRGPSPKYFLHLSRLFGAEPYTFPPAFVAECIAAQQVSGDLIGTSPITGPVYVA